MQSFAKMLDQTSTTFPNRKNVNTYLNAFGYETFTVLHTKKLKRNYWLRNVFKWYSVLMSYHTFIIHFCTTQLKSLPLFGQVHVEWNKKKCYQINKLSSKLLSLLNCWVRQPTTPTFYLKHENTGTLGQVRPRFYLPETKIFWPSQSE